MIQTSTQLPLLQATEIPSKPATMPVCLEEPSAQAIRNILSYSRNLDVHPSDTMGHFEFIRS